MANKSKAYKKIKNILEEKNIRSYNFNAYYINKLIKLSEYTNKKEICNKLMLTENALNLKIGGRTLIYINEGIEIAHSLHMDILDVFCPTEQNMFNVMYDIKEEFKEKKYRKFNLNNKYLNKLMSNNHIKKKDLCDLWGLKQVSIYDKIRGDTKITVKEGILFSYLLNMDINTIFCPTNKQILNVISKEFRDKYNANKDTLIIKDYNKIAVGFDIKQVTCDKTYIHYLLLGKNKTLEDLNKLWGITSTHAYNKLNRINPINLDEAFKLSEFLQMPLKTIFNPTKEQVEEAYEYFINN